MTVPCVHGSNCNWLTLNAARLQRKREHLERRFGEGAALRASGSAGEDGSGSKRQSWMETNGL